jgi:hypothetical protein
MPSQINSLIKHLSDKYILLIETLVQNQILYYIIYSNSYLMPNCQSKSQAGIIRYIVYVAKLYKYIYDGA